MQYQLTDPEKSTAKTKLGWKFWTIFVVTALTFIANIRTPGVLVYAIPINCLIWLAVVWVARSTFFLLRRAKRWFMDNYW